jgi:hypothetical protein
MTGQKLLVQADTGTIRPAGDLADIQGGAPRLDLKVNHAEIPWHSFAESLIQVLARDQVCCCGPATFDSSPPNNW